MNMGIIEIDAIDNFNGIFYFKLLYPSFVDEIGTQITFHPVRVQLVRELMLADVEFPSVEDNKFRRFSYTNAVV